MTSTRQDLLDATRATIRTAGLAGASSREITRAAHANLAAITYYFGSKDALITEALFGELERRVQPALALLDGPGPPEARLVQVVAALSEEFERSRADTLVYFEALVSAARDGQADNVALALYQSLRDRLAETMVELQADEAIPAWVDPPAMGSLILAVANGIALQTRLDPDGPGHATIASQFAQLLLAAR